MQRRQIDFWRVWGRFVFLINRQGCHLIDNFLTWIALGAIKENRSDRGCELVRNLYASALFVDASDR